VRGRRGPPPHNARRKRPWSFRSADDPTPPALGGRLCLAFVNSILWRRSAEPTDLLVDYRATVAYLSRVGLVTDPERAVLNTAAAAHPIVAGRVHADAMTLREALFRLLSAVAHDTRPAPADVAVLTTKLQESLAHLKVVASEGGSLEASWRASTHRLEWPVWEVAGSAAGLLLSGEPTWLKQCPGERCGWLFVDRSRSHTRRWCASTMCGNRDRARRHHQRARHTATRTYHAARETATKPSDS
jgi:predicted RNA-binding Zn ribbon-like protein